MNEILISLGTVVVIWLAVKLKAKFFRKKEMYGYFEYVTEDGSRETSRDYGPMLEVDATGAMLYREQTGAKITFEFFNSDYQKVENEIDRRYGIEQRDQQARKRRGF